MFGIQDKIIAIGLAALLTISAAVNLKQWFHARDLRTANRVLDKQINDPKTGYAVRLATCRGNVQTLGGGIDRQNASIAANAARGAAAVADATKFVADAQVKTAQAIKEANDILSAPMAGATVCEQMTDLDRRIMESLK